MTNKEVYDAFENAKEIYTFKRYSNGDYMPFKGFIDTIKVEVSTIEYVNLKSMHGDTIQNVNIQYLYSVKDLPKLKKYILNKELEELPKEIKILEEDLKYKKRKFERYKKQLEEVNKNEQ